MDTNNTRLNFYFITGRLLLIVFSSAIFVGSLLIGCASTSSVQHERGNNESLNAYFNKRGNKDPMEKHDVCKDSLFGKCVDVYTGSTAHPYGAAEASRDAAKDATRNLLRR